MRRLLLRVVLLTACAPASTLAQCVEPLVNSAAIVRQTNGIYRLEIRLAQDLVIPANATVLNVPPTSMTLVFDSTTLAGPDIVATATSTPDDPRLFVTEMKPGFFIPATLRTVNVQVANLDLACGRASLRTNAGVALTPDDLQARFAAARERLTAHATPQDQKNIYAAFAAVDGKDGDGAGAADIIANLRLFEPLEKVGTLFDNADVKLQIKKNSGAGADPAVYTTGFEMTKALLLGAARRARLARDLTVDDIANLEARRGLFRGLVIYEQLELEGAAFTFDSVNFVTDTQFTLPSVAKSLGSRGFYNFRVLAGAEIGRNLTQPGAPTGLPLAPDTAIGRSKAGGDFSLRFLQSEINPSNFAVQVDMTYLSRWLHRSEVVTTTIEREGQSVRQFSVLESGRRSWRQVDLKVFLFGDARARYGIQLSHYKGGLPPLFAPVEAFQFGLVIESADDNSDGTPANVPSR